MVDVIQITSREQWLALRRQDVTASVVGALLGVSDYVTAYGLWALKSGRVAEDPEDNPAMKRGRLLEPVALQLLAEERPTWSIEAPGVYLRDPAVRLGATPDAYATRPDIAGRGVVQIKTTTETVFRSKWLDPDTRDVVPPMWIVAQAIVEAHLSGASWACVACLVVGFGIDLHIIEIPIHRGLIGRVEDEVREFWRRVAEDNPPPADYGRDGAIIAGLYADDDGAEIDLSDDARIAELIAERARLKVIEAQGSAAEKTRKRLDAEIVHRLGNAARARLAGGATVEAKTVKRSGFTVAPSSYRTVKVKDGIASASAALHPTAPLEF
jgi:predicted phage-related endonuclease